MAKVDSIDAVRLREILSYDPDTGHFMWRWGHRRRLGKDGTTGHLSKAGYVQIYVDNVNQRAHRLAWLYVYGEYPHGYIDHINGNKADNRIANLRDTSPLVNAQNRRPVERDTTSGYAGVAPFRGGYRADIEASGIRHYLGYYETAKEAAAAYEAGRRLLHKGAVFI